VGLDDDPFTWQRTKDGRVRVFRAGSLVATIVGRRADRFLSVVDSGDEDAFQQALARLTGNYKRGNER
jgi:hypothetical protein